MDPASQALLDAYHMARPDVQLQQIHLDSRYKYLRVQVGQREAIMVLGYLDSSGEVEVWYSALGEVLRLRDGRLIGARMNLGTDWLSVSFSHLPRWDQITAQTTFERSRDISTGYQYGIREQMQIRRIATPDDSNLKSIDAASLTWFEEHAPGSVPASRYGVSFADSITQVVYAEQCLSVDFCFSWQKWPPQKESKP